MSSVDHARLRERLFTWYRENKRDLPWRRTRDPYAIWLSEVMLQQTRVDTVIPYYERFLSEYPTVSSLAEAPLDDVLARWSGLGYYRRARALHSGARMIAEERDGAFPKRAAELEEIAGIGPYTAGAVASIAFDEPAPLVDGNVARVLARIFEIEEDVRAGSGRQKVWNLAADLVPQNGAGEFNQALMELGALVCTPRAPRCLLCPVRDLCAVRAHGREVELPIVPARKPPRAWARTALVATRRDEVFLARRRGDRLFGGMWEPPAVDASEESVDARRRLAKMLGLDKHVKYTQKGAVVHVLSHRKMSVAVFSAIAKRAKFTANDEYECAKWVRTESLADLAVSSLAKKILTAAGVTPSSREPRERRKRST